MRPSRQSPVVAIIGGGFSGAAIAYHLDQALGRSGSVDVVVIEPRERLGAGLAYSTTDPACRVNVPASRMSLDPETALQFEAWLASSGALADDPEASLPDGRKFPRREIFGRYVAEALAPALAAGRIRHRRALVRSVRPAGKSYVLDLSDGSRIEADAVVIALTHPPPTPPAVFAEALGRHRSFIPDSTRPGALARIGSKDRVLIVGTGLTMADIVASLDASGHEGPITAFSRRGQLPAQHPTLSTPPFGDFLARPCRSAGALVSRIRQAVADAENRGLPWQSVFDTLRLQGQGIWRSLPVDERRRIVRHLRAFWDARRFRIAPQVQAVLDRLKKEGRLTILSGSAREVAVDHSGVHVGLAQRPRGEFSYVAADAVVIATGPSHRDLLTKVPCLVCLAQSGLLRPDSVGLGLEADARGHAVGMTGKPIDTMFIGGPLARGTFGELMGLPEVSRYAVDVAAEIASWIASHNLLAREECRRQTA